MIAVVQRVSEARVVIEGAVAGDIGPGLLVLLCAEHGDSEAQADRMLTKILKLRIFNDAAGKMNHSVQNMLGAGDGPAADGSAENALATMGGLLIVSQFTLAADASGGNRPSFTGAAKPEAGRRLYDYFVAQAKRAHPIVQTGQFGADMQVHLVNDGPVTIPLFMPPES